MRWPSSLRARLTVWFTLVLGAPLIAFAFVSYVIFARTLLDRTDEFIRDALSAFSRELVAERRQAESAVSALQTTVDEVRFRDLQIIIFNDSNRVVARGDHAEADPDLRAAEPLDVQRVARLLGSTTALPFANTLDDRAGGYRVHARTFELSGERLVLTAAYPLHGIRDTLARIRAAFLVAIPLLLAIASAGGYFLARRSLSPVSSMAARAAEITAANLHERLPVATPRDELGGLALVVNDLLDRLEASFAQQRRFMADASHELRTPTAIVRTEAEVTLAREHREESEYRDSIRVMLDATQRLTRVVDDLFLLARADAGHLSVKSDNLYLDEVVHTATRGVQHIAERQGVQVKLVHVVDAPFRGDADLLGRSLLNLLDNAIRYSPRGATVEVHLSRQGDHYHVTVTDVGPGIPADVQGQVFDRFFRIDSARARSEGSTTTGAGLGLAIARHIAVAHGGQLELQESQPGRTVFRLVLPANVAA
ncbi:MAG: ATP-binding protein [Gemmatimonadaceae bacterium]